MDKLPITCMSYDIYLQSNQNDFVCYGNLKINIDFPSKRLISEGKKKHNLI